MKQARMVALSTVAFLSALATPALAAQATTPSGLIQDVNVSQTSMQAGQPTEAVITTGLRAADGSHPSATFEITVHLPTGMVRNSGSFAICDLSVLRSQGPGGCPADSRIGTGLAISDIRPVVLDPVTARVTILNGQNGSILLFVFPDLGPTLVIEGEAVDASTIAFHVPPVFTLPSAPLAALTQLRLDFQPGYLINPPDCPSAGWEWAFAFSYENEENLALSVNTPCTGGPPSPPSGEGNRAKACKAEASRLGEIAFADKYGTNRNLRNAHGKCASQNR